MKGLIITNPYDKSIGQCRKVCRMTEEFNALGVQTEVIANDGFIVRIINGAAYCKTDADFVVYFDKDKYTAQLLEKCGIRVFNRARATAICDDKMQTHITLCNNGITMPDTLGGALCYIDGAEVSDGYLQEAVRILGLPMIVKQCYGSYGEQVYLANGLGELRNIVNSIKGKAYLFQQYIEQSRGRDLRVIVIGGKVVCGMLRKSETDFRSNVERGAKAYKADVPDDVKALCEKTAKLIGLDYCGIDVLLGEKPYICEVNSNAMFNAMEQVSGVNVARAYAEHVIECVNRGV